MHTEKCIKHRRQRAFGPLMRQIQCDEQLSGQVAAAGEAHAAEELVELGASHLRRDGEAVGDGNAGQLALVRACQLGLCDDTPAATPP